MKIHRLQYTIDYVHILTFRDEYKPVVVPYFGFSGVEYAVENENSINENFRLIFKEENFAIILRKEGIVLVCEGDINHVKSPTSPTKILWDIYTRVKEMKGWVRNTRHTISVKAVEILPKADVEEVLENPKFLALNPWGKLTDFSCMYEWQNHGKTYKFMYGNYSEKDIAMYALDQLQTDANEELYDSVGMMCGVDIFDNESSPNFTKFKSLLSDAEEVISRFKKAGNGKK